MFNAAIQLSVVGALLLTLYGIIMSAPFLTMLLTIGGGFLMLGAFGWMFSVNPYKHSIQEAQREYRDTLAKRVAVARALKLNREAELILEKAIIHDLNISESQIEYLMYKFMASPEYHDCYRYMMTLN